MSKVIDLFAGMEGWSAAFKEHGDEIFTTDWEPSFDVDLVADIRELDADDFPFQPDVILSSPPCEKFSIMTIGRYWNKDNTPKDPRAQEAIDTVQASLKLIEELNPKFWIMENPLGKLRKLDFMQPYERRTVTYCKLGLPYRKATDLWGVFPPSLELPEPCKNGSPCHMATPRGSKTGIQSNSSKQFGRLVHPDYIENPGRFAKPRGAKTYRGGITEEMARYPSWSKERKQLTAMRAKIPYDLSKLVHDAVERDL